MPKSLVLPAYCGGCGGTIRTVIEIPESIYINHLPAQTLSIYVSPCCEAAIFNTPPLTQASIANRLDDTDE